MLISRSLSVNNISTSSRTHFATCSLSVYSLVSTIPFERKKEMMGNCEKMVVISSDTSNQWPQNEIDEKNLMASTTGCRLMEKQISQEQQQQALKCPRCDSSNTKFCYYNNYSLSQPRHFCKACKRYWTRGGTLRNVPVGGGCRKNKRVKRPSATATPNSSIDGSSNSAKPNLQSSVQPHQINISSSSTTTNSNHHMNNNAPLFYGLLPSNPSDHLNNLPFSTTRFNDLQPQFSSLGLGFSSGMLRSSSTNHDNYPIFGSSSSTPTMASFLASTLHGQQKLINGTITHQAPSNHFQTLASLHDHQDLQMKEVVKVELQGGQSWNYNNVACQNQIMEQQIGLSSSDPNNSLYWNTSSNVNGAWHDPSNNIGSSVTSLI